MNEPDDKIERSQGYPGLLGMPLEPGTEEGLLREFGLLEDDDDDTDHDSDDED